MIMEFVFALVTIIFGIFFVVTLWKIAKAHEILANSSKEIAETLKNLPK